MVWCGGVTARYGLDWLAYQVHSEMGAQNDAVDTPYRGVDGDIGAAAASSNVA